MKNRFHAFGSTLLAATFIAGCKPAAEQPTPMAPLPPVHVQLVQPKRGEIYRSVSLPATVEANQQVTLYSKVAGYLKSIAVDNGDEVKKGDVLAEIEAPELLADFAKSKAEFEIAELDSNRAADARKKAPDLVVAQSVDAAKSKLAMARANLDRAETLLGFCKITAPFSGRVTKRFVDPGAFVPAATSGASAQNAALVILADFKMVRVHAAVPETEVSRIKNGLPVKISVDGLPGRSFQGSVTRFSHVLDDATKTMLTEIDLENAKGELRPGMYATVKIGVEKHSDTLMLPVDGVLVEKSGASVFMVADGKVKKIPVQTGFNDGAFVEITKGLAENEAVILLGKALLQNGQAVNVAEAK